MPEISSSLSPLSCDVAIIGGGPAGLMAAEAAAEQGLVVRVFDGKPSVGRKFLLAGKGGLNLTHSEAFDHFVQRYGDAGGTVETWLGRFGAQDLQEWAQALGIETFVGTSGRVFPKDMKAAPLLRAWLQRLRQQGVAFHMRHRWEGWREAELVASASDAQGAHAMLFSTPEGAVEVEARAVVLALGGGSWARLGSDGAWVPMLVDAGVPVAPLRAANCGFDTLRAHAPLGETRREFLRGLIGQAEGEQGVGWSPHFKERFAGQPFKSVAIEFTDSRGRHFQRRGEFVATETGVEGSLIYAVSALLRDEIEANGTATFTIDLLPALSHERVLQELRHPRGSRSLSNHLKSRLHLDGIKAALLYEQLGKDEMNDPVVLARAIKAAPITVVAARPMDEAISTAGGVRLDALDEHCMLRAMPGVFCAGEMLDWEAPTGGYLLTACFATGHLAGKGARQRLLA
ncbi:TIGR03862 family flavoprotein [Diaphorobacter ruginosibacter]|uniref:TIGR03862 family flavoprotein n=1 Tax=Diaphorobacter ruginosibacter TaxID=1715720 RepID=A0A7G9RTF6_9BURK|nr:TIGR03862 family flavoprotein [Diaphorobacter ruginosibacter]QNN58881.1 TIGR03862 family flavoprotein [Diaphorobacter ruginosibacter]